jgi:triosephosphate isomerase
MAKPILLINTKAYSQGTGEGAIKLARIARRLSSKSDANIILAVQPTDIPLISKTVTTYAQHIDAVTPGAHTGHILPESVKASGAKGTLINHSERRLDLREIKERILRARQLKLATVAAAPYTVMVSKIASLAPDCIAIEPPELIGTGVSVSTAKPYVIRRSVEIARKVNPRIRVLCGAGISAAEDASKALELGTSGVLVASAIVKSKNPESAIRDILKGFS